MSPLMPYESTFVDVGKNRLRVWVAGQGPPLLLLHGYPETAIAWRHAFAAFSSRYRCVAPDLTGWGASTGNGPLTIDSLVLDMVSLVQALALDRPVIVGHDFGAAIAYAIGAFHPALASRIVTLNFSPGRFQVTRPLHFYFFALPLLPQLVMRLFPRRFTRLLFRWWAHDARKIGEDALRVYLDAAATRQSRRATLSYYRSLIRPAAVGRPPLGMGPLRDHTNPGPAWDVVWGLRDPVATPKVLAWLKGEFPGLHVHEIPEAGHFPHEETPAEFTRALEAILDSSTGAR
jgi:pimeloyl-ACP methyl ester carboxylesterase